MYVCMYVWLDFMKITENKKSLVSKELVEKTETAARCLMTGMDDGLVVGRWENLDKYRHASSSQLDRVCVNDHSTQHHDLFTTQLSAISFPITRFSFLFLFTLVILSTMFNRRYAILKTYLHPSTINTQESEPWYVHLVVFSASKPRETGEHP